MSIPILATKLYIPPPRPKFVPRPRLIERLNEDLQRKLTLVSAPAGFGKTTLVSAWLSDCGCPAAWLSLDENDGDPARFLTYLIAAVQTIAPQAGAGVLAAVQSPQADIADTLLTALVNELAAIAQPFILVLDDYHAVDAQPVDHALAFLIEHLPPQMHLAIITREDPPLPLARLRARGQMTELRVADLRFTLDEAAGFLNQVMGLSLSADDVAALETRTEGWIAGLQLAALSMQGSDDVGGFVRSFTGSHAFVLDYLVEEVLHKQPDAVQTFLLRTSILERMCSPLCDAVLGADSTSGEDTLAYLERANLFLIPLDNERRWYRYHHLFGDLLRQRLLKDDAAQAASLHVRASQWYEANHEPADAIRHALAAKDFERAARLLELTWTAMDESFQTNTWIVWISAVPDAVIRRRPVLSVDYAWALLNRGEMEAASARLDDAEDWLDMPDNRSQPMVVVDEGQFRWLPASLATARTYILQAYGDIPASMEYAQRALDLLPETDYVRRGQIDGLLSLAHWSIGDLEAGHRYMAEAMTNFYTSGNIAFANSCTVGMGPIRIAQGRLRDAQRTYEQALRIALEQGEPIPGATADLYLSLAALHREWNELDAADDVLQRGEELGERAGLPDWQHRMYIARARMHLTRRELDDALALLNEAEHVYYRTPMPDVRPIPAMRARVWLLQGRLAEAQAWARKWALAADDALSYLREFEHITLARVLIAQYRRDGDERAIHDATTLLDRLLAAAEEGGRLGTAIEILLLLALSHEAQGHVDVALMPLERALALAEPEGYVRSFVDEGDPMQRLLAEALGRGIHPDYASRLLAAFETESQPGARSSSAAAQPLIDPLSERELEVLQLIAQGLSNSEIAERLFLALSTVKGHNRIIFDKLHVQRRTEAVARARELGLLEA
ncbi:MAG: AAA family ATPase [Anaerolineae bacterium]|nr:AAA family ATPase [Anaerolineae bacterium]